MPYEMIGKLAVACVAVLALACVLGLVVAAWEARQDRRRFAK